MGSFPKSGILIEYFKQFYLNTQPLGANLTENEWIEKLISLAKKLNVSLTKAQSTACLEHCKLILQWNNSHNLTTITEFDKMLKVHVLDSLAILPFIEKDFVIDIGTGAGFPGLILAIAKPQLKVVGVDSNRKKTLFLTQAAYQLKLNNFFPYHQRVEQTDLSFLTSKFGVTLTSGITYVARAFAPTLHLLQLVNPFLDSQSQLIIMKGQEPSDDIQDIDIKNNFNVTMHPLEIPELLQKRHLLLIRKV